MLNKNKTVIHFSDLHVKQLNHTLCGVWAKNTTDDINKFVDDKHNKKCVKCKKILEAKK